MIQCSREPTIFPVIYGQYLQAKENTRKSKRSPPRKRKRERGVHTGEIGLEVRGEKKKGTTNKRNGERSQEEQIKKRQEMNKVWGEKERKERERERRGIGSYRA